MKKILYALLLLCLCVNMQAQETANQIVVDSVTAKVNGANLDVQFSVTASNLKINCNGERILEFALESADRRLVLPTVVYSGSLRYLYERRSELLSGERSVKPYHIYKGVKEDKTYKLLYTLSIPYQTWMGGTNTITLSQYVNDCSGLRETGQGLTYSLSLKTPTVGLSQKTQTVSNEVRRPSPELFAGLVNFLVPEVEEVKARAAMIELNIGFPVNITAVRPDFGNNRSELIRADSLVSLLHNSDLLAIKDVNIKGYASPEGRYANNERLAKGRAESFKQYLITKYPANEYLSRAVVSYIPEDWEGLGKLIEESNIPAKKEILGIVYDNGLSPDTKDKVLQKIVWWSQNYGVILREMYPHLRRIELRVDYTVPALDERRAQELLYTHPEYLSLDEIYRIAHRYEPGTKEYREVYEIAAKTYPDDAIANHNAAAALLQQGEADAAFPYLKKTESRTESLINFGAYHYIKGNMKQADDYFRKAEEAGIEQATQNRKLINLQ